MFSRSPVNWPIEPNIYGHAKGMQRTDVRREWSRKAEAKARTSHANAAALAGARLFHVAPKFQDRLMRLAARLAHCSHVLS